MLIKICRLRDPENIVAVSALMPHYMGFDFSSDRASYMGELDESLLWGIDRRIRRVGLFTNDSPLYIAYIAGRFGLNTIQLDGRQSPESCEILAAEGLEVIKSISISGPDSFDATVPYEGICNKFLFRLTPTLDLQATLDHYHGTTPFLLSLKLDNMSVDQLSSIDHDRLVGFDFGSSFEIQPALKDIYKLTRFLQSMSR